MSDFGRQYAGLEERFRLQAETDGDMFLPNVPPVGPVDFVFIALEPSLKRWAKSPNDARAQVAQGFKNFLFGFEDFIVHYCIRRFLCLPGQTYYLTDFSKGAMPVDSASRDRRERYDRWYPLLLEEVDLVSKRDAGVFAVGGAAAYYLQKKGFRHLSGRLLHYSGQAAAHRKKYIQGREPEFEAFGATLGLDQIVDTAKSALAEAGFSVELAEKTLARIRNSAFTDSRKELVFAYKVTFDDWRRWRL